jgi:hypothetical protein
MDVTVALKLHHVLEDDCLHTLGLLAGLSRIERKLLLSTAIAIEKRGFIVEGAVLVVGWGGGYKPKQPCASVLRAVFSSVTFCQHSRGNLTISPRVTRVKATEYYCLEHWKA